MTMTHFFFLTDMGRVQTYWYCCYNRQSEWENQR